MRFEWRGGRLSLYCGRRTLEGWKGSSSTEYDKENKTYHITLTNAPIRYGSLTVSKEVTGSGDKEKCVHV